jgi:hypothetical protein
MATGAPGTNGVWQYGEDDSEATFSALLNKVASTTDTQIGTDRGRLTTLEARPVSGLVPISPSSVVIAGGTGSTTTAGQVTFTTATSISLNSVFSSTYRNYRLLLNVTGTSAAVTSVSIRFRTGTTDNANSSYFQYWTIKRISGVLQDNSGGPATSFALISKTNANTYGSWTGDIMSPNVSTQSTTATGLGHSSDATSSYNVSNTVLFDPNTAFDGITLLSTSGNITGTVQILGYND